MNKNYERADLNIIVFGLEDLIITSGGEDIVLPDEEL